MKFLTSFTFLRIGHSLIVLVLCGLVDTPWLLKMCPRKLTSCCNKIHFFWLSFKLASFSRMNISFKFYMCSSNVFENTIISSRKIKQLTHNNPDKTRSINRSKVAGALHSQKGMTVNCHKAPPKVEKAVLGRSFSANRLAKNRFLSPL